MRVLDIGCGQGELFNRIKKIESYVGLDPDLDKAVDNDKFHLIPGKFPQDFKSNQKFDVIIMLAVLEHLPSSIWEELYNTCKVILEPGGLIIVTVPDPKIDHILSFLLKLKLIDGMKLEEHHGFQPSDTLKIFKPDHFRLKAYKQFQLGLNNLYVFEKV